MRVQLAIALAASLILQGGAFAQDVDNAVKDTGHATAKTTKDAAHGTAEAAEKTTDATGHVVKKSGKGIKKGAHEVGHGVKKGATKPADALKSPSRDTLHGTCFRVRWAPDSSLGKSRCEKPSHPPGMHSSTQHACQAVILPRLGAGPHWRSWHGYRLAAGKDNREQRERNAAYAGRRFALATERADG